MKRTTRFLTFFLAGFLLFGCAAREDKPPVPGVKIPSDPQLCFTGEVEIEPAKLARFEKEIEGREARLFADPAELTDGEIGAIAERFGFSADQRTEAGPDRSVYKDPQKKTEIRIDRLGIYTYICDAGNGAPEPPYERSDEESASLARKFLKDRGIPASGFSKWAVEVRAFHTVEGKTEVTEKSVAFYRDDGFWSRLDGGAEVWLRGDGTVSEMSSYDLRFRTERRTELVSIEEAIGRIRRGEATIWYDDSGFDSAEKIEIEGFTPSYLTKETPEGDTVVQPWYFFYGTAFGKNGKTSAFRLTVQANRY